MIIKQARSILNAVFSPVSIDTFFDDYMGHDVLEVTGDIEHARRFMLGTDPFKTLLDAYATHGNRLASHSDAPNGPSPLVTPVNSPGAFRTLIQQFHERGYTVRIPAAESLSPELRKLTRAIEFMLHKPANASLFWSAPGARAPVHYDDNDNIIIQLSGQKRWFISNSTPSLHNPWRDTAEGPAVLDAHHIVDVDAGDLIYIPRGLPHKVVSHSESLHISLTFTPITVREMIISALDHLSDHDRSLREVAIGRIDSLPPTLALSKRICGVLERLHEASQSSDFLRVALERRSSRAIGNMERLVGKEPQHLSLSSVVRHTPLAMCHFLVTSTMIDFCQPGEHINVHRGVEPALRFIASMPSFRVSDLPGDLSTDIRNALINRLITSGFLELDIGN